MKIWTLTTDESGSQTAIHFSQESADAQAVEIVTAWYERFCASDTQERDHTDWRETYSILCDTLCFCETLAVEEHDISAHPAVKEAEATLYSCLNRLELNDMDGEEQPFMADCHTAIALLTA